MKILIAPNAFKGNLSASEVSRAIISGFSSELFQVKTFPIADGGDGTLEVFLSAFSGKSASTLVINPVGETINARWGWLDSTTSIIEMSNASGIKLLHEKELNPLLTTSYGTGQLIKVAIEMGAKKVLLGIGGSATVDGGIGMLSALGTRFFDANGKEILDQLLIKEVVDIDLSKCQELLNGVSITILSDVDNPLLGESGAASVFGPQKGANKSMVEILEERLTKWSQLIIKKTGRDLTGMQGAGAAGGIGYALASIANAKMVNGFNFLLEESELKNQIKECDVLITGEGEIDAQTIAGKGPGKIAGFAKSSGKICIGVCGLASATIVNSGLFHKIFTLVKTGITKEYALSNSVELLKNAAIEIESYLLSIDQ